MADKLEHVGVLGMKWGVHRRGPDSTDFTTAHTLKKKRVAELSNDEIRKVTTRLQLEKQLKDLNPKTIGFGQKLFSNLLGKFGPAIIRSFVKKYTKVDFNDPFASDSPFDATGEVIDLKFLKD